MKHWQPDEEIARVVPVRRRHALSAGAKAGLVLVAAACASIALLAWQIAAPRDPFH